MYTLSTEVLRQFRATQDRYLEWEAGAAVATLMEANGQPVTQVDNLGDLHPLLITSELLEDLNDWGEIAEDNFYRRGGKHIFRLTERGRESCGDGNAVG